MAETLRPEGIPVTVGDVVVTTPGLTGSGRGVPSGHRRHARRGAGPPPTCVGAGRGVDAGAAVRRPVTADRAHRRATAPGPVAGRTTSSSTCRRRATGNGQVLLYAAEDGSLSWHLPDDVRPDTVPTRGGERRTYRVPRAVVPTDEPEPTPATAGVLGGRGPRSSRCWSSRWSTRCWAGRRLLRQPVGGQAPAQPGAVDDASRATPTPRPRRSATPTGPPSPAGGGCCSSTARSPPRTAPSAGCPPRRCERCTSSYGGRVAALDHPTCR